ncbi:MAG: hypothetical protein A2231_04950 [Candidatus Firestonebacteria bacterium RIFOXYA2_FULL_40_8]|nr:MAG: hypothetical protein A2231_04950 [Candidatus Firestonebacteria bacterium RIFOXYA2_FULL_40_8]
MSTVKKLIYWLPAGIFAVCVFYLSSISNPPGVRLLQFIPNSDKLAHMTEYFILSSLIFFALARGHNIKTNKAIIIAILLTAAYAITDEYHQSFTPGRSMDVLDWAADTAGAIIVSTRYEVQSTKLKRKKLSKGVNIKP